MQCSERMWVLERYILVRSILSLFLHSGTRENRGKQFFIGDTSRNNRRDCREIIFSVNNMTSCRVNNSLANGLSTCFFLFVPRWRRTSERCVAFNGDLDASCIKASPIAQIAIHFDINSDSLYKRIECLRSKRRNKN